MDKEEKYTEIRDKLLNLEPVKASDDFVHNLHNKIVEIESEKRREHEKRFDESRGGFLKNLFGNMQYPWLVPAAGFTVLIFFIFYVTYLNRSEIDGDQNLLSTQNQETTTEQNKSPVTENNAAEKESNSLNEQEDNIAGKDNTPGENIAGDLKTEEKEDQNAPHESQNENPDRRAPKVYKDDESKPTMKSKPEDVYDGMAVEKKQTEIIGRTAEKNEISTFQAPQDKVESGVGEEKTKSALSDGVKSNTRLKQKIDSLSKIDLKKLREEVVK